MVKKNATMIAMAIALGLAIPAGALAQDNSGSGPAVVSPLQLPGTASSPQAQIPQNDPGVNWKGVGVGAGTVVGNVLYIPAKLVYGILGGVAGGAGWALTGGNTEVANTIWRSSLGGDYVLTPNMVAGQDPVHFSGPTDTAQQPGQSLPPAPQTSAAYGNTRPSSGPTSMSTSPSTIGSVSGGTHPMDSGAGPVGGSAASRSSRISGPLPSTSIE
jgi:hypothetical protein